MSEPIPFPAPARFVCSQHGPTNTVIGLMAQAYCTHCLCDLAEKQLTPVRRFSQEKTPA